MVTGLGLSIVRSGQPISGVVPLDQVLTHVFRGDAPGVIDLGILLLFATPLVGVIVSLAEFLRRGDWPFVGVAALLLVLVGIGFGIALR
jgi:uncharacterized membrane protein